MGLTITEIKNNSEQNIISNNEFNYVKNKPHILVKDVNIKQRTKISKDKTSQFNLYRFCENEYIQLQNEKLKNENLARPDDVRAFLTNKNY